MTVGELRALLSAYPDDMRVLVDGYEGGYADPKVGQPTPMVTLAENAHWWGKYDEQRDGYRGDRPGVPFDAIVLSR